MKKFLALALASFVSMAASATLYLTGDADDLAWLLPGRIIIATAPGVYTFTATNLSAFRISDIYTSDWNEYSDNCYGLGDSSFGAGVYPDGETHAIVRDADNQVMPYVGDYVVTVDLNTKTMTAKALSEPAEKPDDIYIQGDMNDWCLAGLDNLWKFDLKGYTSADNAIFEFIADGETVIRGGLKFKIGNEGLGAYNFGISQAVSPDPHTTYHLDYDGAPISFTSDFKGKITLTLYGLHSATAIFDNEATSIAIEADADCTAEYFNMQGIRIDVPTHGLFIERRGSSIRKVLR